MAIPKYYQLRVQRAQLEDLVDSVIRRKTKNRELATAFMDKYRRPDEDEAPVTEGGSDGNELP